MRNLILLLFLSAFFSCSNEKENQQALNNKISPTLITETVPNDTDDPAIWINPDDLSGSLILGTDKEADGGIYTFDLEGKILSEKTIHPVGRPNNIDIVQAVSIGDTTLDIAVYTERLEERIRVISLPDMQFVDGGGIPVFTGEDSLDRRACMGISLFHDQNEGFVYAFVSRKDGPSGSYIWQYRLDFKDSLFTGTIVRKFGEFSGNGEIEAIGVDDELGYVYYSDESRGIYKYYAHPDSGNTLLALFGEKDFKEDREGIAIWSTGPGKGFLLISDQQDHSFEVYPREGSEEDPHRHISVASLKLSTVETDGCEVYPDSLSPKFPNGVFIAMSEGAVFHYYDLGELKRLIDR